MFIRLWFALILGVLSTAAICNAQAGEKFDIVTFSPPIGWAARRTTDSVQFTRTNASGGYCIITLFRSVSVARDAETHFAAAWAISVAEPFRLKGLPETQRGEKDGWTTLTGLAPFDSGELNGAAMLTTFSGGGKMLSMLVLTNTEAFERDIAAFADGLRLPKVAQATATQLPNQAAPISAARRSKFKFVTTNFDDGWVSVEQDDWVRASKGDITVLLHYPHPKDNEYISSQEARTRLFWDMLVAPRYSNLRDFELLRYDRSFEPGSFAAGNLRDNATGNSVYVVLFDKAKTGWIEIVAPSKAAFERAFGRYDLNADIIDWSPLQRLLGYNKFAVDAADLSGTWSTTFSGTLAYSNIDTGRLVGMSSVSTSQTFVFGGGNSYSWQTHGATVTSGAARHQGAKSAGRLSMPSNWQISFSNIEGRPRSVLAHFSAIRGARILWIDGNAYGKID